MEFLSSFSKWFYLGALAIVIGIIMAIFAHGNNRSKLMENAYFLIIIGAIGVLGQWTDFATILFLLVLFVVVVIILNRLIFIKMRPVGSNVPHIIYYAREFLPILLVVWILRAFLFEAFQIPSSSMRPTLIVGDFILVNKFDYGLRMPFTNKVFLPIGQIARGDVVVFKDPTTKNRDLIKRAIGIPGDVIKYDANKQLTINGQLLNYTPDGTYQYTDTYPQGVFTFNNNRFIEDLLGKKHAVITMDKMPPVFSSEVKDFPNKENCQYLADNSGFTCTVPKGEYFMMGDNRDNSDDSRYWGFAKDQEILGKAIYVWMNFHDFSRIGTKIL